MEASFGLIGLFVWDIVCLHILGGDLAFCSNLPLTLLSDIDNVNVLFMFMINFILILIKTVVH